MEKRNKSFIDVVSLPHVRATKLVIDLEDRLTPAMTIEGFIEEFGFMPEPPRYRVVVLEMVTCAQDEQPVLVGECGRCPKFMRRAGDRIYCKAAVGI